LYRREGWLKLGKTHSRRGKGQNDLKQVRGGGGKPSFIHLQVGGLVNNGFFHHFREKKIRGAAVASTAIRKNTGVRVITWGEFPQGTTTSRSG